MGKTSIEDAVKELRRMSKRMKRVSNTLLNLAHIDERFGAKAEEMEIASLITEEWAESIYEEFLLETENAKRFSEEISKAKE